MVSQYEKDLISEGIVLSLGGVGQPQEGWNDFDRFNYWAVEASKVWAPILGQYLGGRQILAADDDTKVKALQTVLAGRALSLAGQTSNVSTTTLTQIEVAFSGLSKEERDRLIDTACSDMMAKTKDAAARAALSDACDRLRTKSWWMAWKWPVILGTAAVGIGVIGFLWKRKELFFEEGRVGLRA